MFKSKIIAAPAASLLLSCLLCGCGARERTAPHYGTYYLNGEQTAQAEAIVLSETEFSFVNCDTDYYLSYLQRGLEGQDVDWNQYRQNALACMAAPYSYEFKPGDRQNVISVSDFDGTGEASLKVEYTEEQSQAKLIIKDKEFICSTGK